MTKEETLTPTNPVDYRPSVKDEAEAALREASNNWGPCAFCGKPWDPAVSYRICCEGPKKAYTTFSSGAQRSEVKPAYDQVVPEFIEGVAKRLAAGQLKYSRDNWKRGVGDKEWIRQVYSHLMQHLLDEWGMKPDDTDGDRDAFGNLDACAWNLMVLNWLKRYDTETYRAARQADV